MHLVCGLPIDIHVNKLERVQNKFLRCLAYKVNILDHTLGEIRALVGIQTLRTRRKNEDTCILYKIICFHIKCPLLLEQINFHVPSRTTRNKVTFATEFHRTNYGKNSPLTRITQNGNNLDVDFFSLITNT